MMAKVKMHVCSTEAESWNVLWKWLWFQKDLWIPNFRKQEDIKEWRRVCGVLLPKLQIKSILDCSCGFGCKTIVLAEMGYDIEGSDGSAFAVEHAKQLAKEEGVDINFFQARWEELGKKSKRKFDCVCNDAFNWITTRKALKAAAKGICSVLKDGGKFIFFGAHQWSQPSDRKKLIEEEWKKTDRFEIDLPYEKGGIKLTKLNVYDKTSDGIVANGIHIIEEHGKMRVNIVPNIPQLSYYKWTWQDYTEVLKEAGFSKTYSVKIKGIPHKVPHVPNIAIK